MVETEALLPFSLSVVGLLIAGLSVWSLLRHHLAMSAARMKNTYRLIVSGLSLCLVGLIWSIYVIAPPEDPTFIPFMVFLAVFGAPFVYYVVFAWNACSACGRPHGLKMSHERRYVEGVLAEVQERATVCRYCGHMGWKPVDADDRAVEDASQLLQDTADEPDLQKFTYKQLLGASIKIDANRHPDRLMRIQRLLVERESRQKQQTTKRTWLHVGLFAFGVWVLVGALVSGEVYDPDLQRDVSFEEAPITFLFGLGLGLWAIGYACRSLIRTVKSWVESRH
jgi:hypothetical protein